MATKTKSVAEFAIPVPGDVTKDNASVKGITLGYTIVYGKRGRTRFPQYQIKFQTERHGVINGFLIGTREELIERLSELGFTTPESTVEVELQISNRGNWYVQLQNWANDTAQNDEPQQEVTIGF